MGVGDRGSGEATTHGKPVRRIPCPGPPSPGPQSHGPPSHGQPSSGPSKISLFFHSPAAVCILSSLSWVSSRGILAVFLKAGP